MERLYQERVNLRPADAVRAARFLARSMGEQN
jgi:hypothetical protein